MQDLYRFYWSNIISRLRLLNHARAHRAFVNNKNTTGIYTEYLVLLDAAILAFATAIEGKVTDLSLQYGDTILTDKDIVDFSDKVHEVYHLILYVSRNSPDIVPEFFPNDLSEYNNIAKENALVLMTFFSNAMDRHSASFDDEIVLWFANQVIKFNLHREEQQETFGNVDDDINVIINGKTSLIGALVAGHGIVAYNNRLSEIEAVAFFNYPLLYRLREIAHLKVDGETLKNSCSLGKQILLDKFNRIGLWNKGTVARVGVFATATLEGVPGPLTKIKWVDPGKHGNTTPQDIDAIDNHFIKLIIDNLTDGSPWELDFHDA